MPEIQAGLRVVKTAKLSVISNSCLVILKLIAAALTCSVSILSEAVHSFIDLTASLIAFFAVKEAGKPADDVHPYGHGKFENISATVEALLIFAAAAVVIYEAVSRLVSPKALEMPAAGAAVMLVSAAVNFFISKKIFYEAKKSGSVALEADGWHLRADVYTSAGVAFALLCVFALKPFFKPSVLCAIDSIAAIAVACFIIKEACALTLKAAKDLFDVRLPDDEVALLEDVIRSDKNISGYHDLKTRKAGRSRFAEFHILVHPQMTVLDSHEITRELKRKIESKFEGISVNIHVEPCDDTCTDKCRRGCLIKNKNAVQKQTQPEKK
jgi:cation diffusion facilitator family transporter